MSARLAERAKAPDFETEDAAGRKLRLSEVPGKRWLAFFRYASCPLCNLQVSKIMKRHAELAAGGLTVLAVFQSPKESMAEYVGKQGPPFALVPDPEERLYALYGVETSFAGFVSPKNAGRLAKALASGFMPGKKEGSATRIPADFLIDADGTIARAYYGKVIADHIPLDDVVAFVKKS
ncbi:MAG: peroxiredoxin-like family protein [Planctomycetota bacterium]